jgi:hypothetical protein
MRAPERAFEKAGDWQSFVVTDGLLITGQNPASSGPAAKALIEVLKKEARQCPHRGAGGRKGEARDGTSQPSARHRQAVGRCNSCVIRQ